MTGQPHRGVTRGEAARSSWARRVFCFCKAKRGSKAESALCPVSKLYENCRRNIYILGLNIRLFDKAFFTLLIEMLKYLKHLKLKLYFVFFGDKCITHSLRGKNILKFSRNIVTAEFLSAGTKAVL